MTVDNRLPEAERRNYKSVFDAWKRIVGEEGVAALWTGCGPTIGRAMVVNVCQLCCQTQAKEEIAKRTSSKSQLLPDILRVFFSQRWLRPIILGVNGCWINNHMCVFTCRYCKN